MEKTKLCVSGLGYLKIAVLSEGFIIQMFSSALTLKLPQSLLFWMIG